MNQTPGAEIMAKLPDFDAATRDRSDLVMLDPTAELPDDTPISDVEFPPRIRNVLTASGLKSVGEVREASDAELLTLQNCGVSTVAYVREKLGTNRF